MGGGPREPIRGISEVEGGRGKHWNQLEFGGRGGGSRVWLPGEGLKGPASGGGMRGLEGRYVNVSKRVEMHTRGGNPLRADGGTRTRAEMHTRWGVTPGKCPTVNHLEGWFFPKEG